MKKLVFTVLSIISLCVIVCGFTLWYNNGKYKFFNYINTEVGAVWNIEKNINMPLVNYVNNNAEHNQKIEVGDTSNNVGVQLNYHPKDKLLGTLLYNSRDVSFLENKGNFKVTSKYSNDVIVGKNSEIINSLNDELNLNLPENVSITSLLDFIFTSKDLSEWEKLKLWYYIPRSSIKHLENGGYELFFDENELNTYLDKTSSIFEDTKLSVVLSSLRGNYLSWKIEPQDNGIVKHIIESENFKITINYENKNDGIVLNWNVSQHDEQPQISNEYSVKMTKKGEYLTRYRSSFEDNNVTNYIIRTIVNSTNTVTNELYIDTENVNDEDSSDDIDLRSKKYELVNKYVLTGGDKDLRITWEKDSIPIFVISAKQLDEPIEETVFNGKTEVSVSDYKDLFFNLLNIISNRERR